MSAKRRDELFARDAVTRFLCPPRKRSDLGWVASESPDWRLQTGDRELWVEVTWVTGTTRLSGREIPNPQIEASLVRWIEDLERRIIDKPWFEGLYVVSMHPIEGLRTHTAVLRDSIVSYVKATQAETTARARELPGQWRIEKVKGTSSRLTYGYSLGGGGFEREIEEECGKLVNAAIARKTHLMSNLSGLGLLVLIDNYRLATIQQWHAAAARPKIPRRVAVLRAYGEYRCELLSGFDPRLVG